MTADSTIPVGARHAVPEPPDALPERPVVCLRCGSLGTQRLAADGVWFHGSCRRCGDGQSLYERRFSAIGGFKPGPYVGDGDEWDGSRYHSMASAGHDFRGT